MASIIPEDIFITIDALNTSFTETIQVQTKSTPETYGLEFGNKNFFSRFFDRLDTVFGLFSLFEQTVKSKLVIDNFYAYSLNRTLVDMPISQLREIPGLKTQYL